MISAPDPLIARIACASALPSTDTTTPAPDNRAADVPDYEGFGLTDNELHFVLTGRTAQRQALLRTHYGSTILNLDLSPLGPLLTALGGGEAGIRAFGTDYASKKHFWRTKDA